ncbi:MAG: hypothetical protein WC091_08860 [Sulfuricellaceae bacterium]
MNAFKTLTAMLLFALFSTTACAITDSQVFAYAEANFPGIFTGTATPGQYQQYNYRCYQASGNCLAVDASGVISIMGPYTGGAVSAVGTVSAFADAIGAWEASQATTPTAADYSGAWTGNYQGFTMVYIITQSGNNLTLKSNPTPLTATQTYTGVLNGNTATVTTNDYAASSSTLTVIDNKTVKVVQNSCVASKANLIYCLVPNGAPVIFTRP